MSISGTLSNAYSGLVAASRSAQVVSQNVSNALTDGFGRREIQLSAAALNGRGAGVRVSGVARNVDQVSLSDRRMSEAALADSTVSADALSEIEKAIGLPGENGSLSDLVARFESALAQAGSRPDSQVRLQSVFDVASDLGAHLNDISATTQDLRMQADAKIANDVETLNTALGNIQKLNRDIRLQLGAGHDVNGLVDQRQVLVDQIAPIIPIKVYQRDFEQIAITSGGGATLLDGKAAVFAFTPVSIITPDMTLASGALSGLSINGKPQEIGQGSGLLEGGRLSGLFHLRDVAAPAASAQADAFSRDLIERFEDPSVDPTLSVGSAGLFTDGGSPVDPSIEVGLAGRVTVNATVNPDKGGALWHLRAGLGAGVDGNIGDNTLLGNFSRTLTGKRAPVSGSFSTASVDLAGLAGQMAAESSGERLKADQDESFARARFQHLKQIELEGGVDTDQEMQSLLLVEQAFAANARVISTVDEMLKTLLKL